MTVTERPRDGYLLINCKSAAFVGHNGNQGPRIANHKYSVHPSLETAEGNTLTNTILLTDGTAQKWHHFTRAIKVTDRFAPLFTRRFYDLSLSEAIKTKAGIETISLGSIQKGFTLLLGVLASSPSREFEGEGGSFSIIDTEFAAFRLTLIWTFLAIPSDHTGTGAHVFTERPENIEDKGDRARNQHTMDGYEEAESVENFFYTCNEFWEEQLLRLAQLAPVGPVPHFWETIFLNSLEYFKEASRQSTQWQAYRQRLTDLKDQLLRER